MSLWAALQQEVQARFSGTGAAAAAAGSTAVQSPLLAADPATVETPQLPTGVAHGTTAAESAAVGRTPGQTFDSGPLGLHASPCKQLEHWLALVQAGAPPSALASHMLPLMAGLSSIPQAAQFLAAVVDSSTSFRNVQLDLMASQGGGGRRMRLFGAELSDSGVMDENRGTAANDESRDLASEGDHGTSFGSRADSSNSAAGRDGQPLLEEASSRLPADASWSTAADSSDNQEMAGDVEVENLLCALLQRVQQLLQQPGDANSGKEGEAVTWAHALPTLWQPIMQLAEQVHAQARAGVVPEQQPVCQQLQAELVAVQRLLTQCTLQMLEHAAAAGSAGTQPSDEVGDGSSERTQAQLAQLAAQLVQVPGAPADRFNVLVAGLLSAVHMPVAGTHGLGVQHQGSTGMVLEPVVLDQLACMLYATLRAAGLVDTLGPQEEPQAWWSAGAAGTGADVVRRAGGWRGKDSKLFER